MATHDMAEATVLAERIYVIDRDGILPAQMQ